MRLSALAFVLLAACQQGSDRLSLADELGFRQLRQDFQLACTTGDSGLLRTTWADNAVLTTPAATVAGGDAITNFIASGPNFGQVLVLTPEASWWIILRGDVAEYGFESVSVDLGGNDPMTTTLASQGAQNPVVEIVEHTHSTGVMVRVEQGRWVFMEFNSGDGPLPPPPGMPTAIGGVATLTQGTGGSSISLGDELGFRRMRQDFHRANMIGDADLMRSVWADDGVFRSPGGTIVGGDAITDFFAGGPSFGKRVGLTPEHSSKIDVQGGIANYGFECVAIDVGGGDPRTTVLASQGSQNPAVEIVMHSNSTGRAERVAAGHWVFKEFNGASGPLPPAPK
jgi:hypothetical protein